MPAWFLQHYVNTTVYRFKIVFVHPLLEILKWHETSRTENELFISKGSCSTCHIGRYQQQVQRSFSASVSSTRPSCYINPSLIDSTNLHNLVNGIIWDDQNMIVPWQCFFVCLWVSSIRVPLWRQLSWLLHPQWRQGHFHLPAQMEGDSLLVVRTLVDEERVEFFSLVLQRLPGESQEYGVAFPEQLEILILPIRWEISCIRRNAALIRMLIIRRSASYLQLRVNSSSDFIIAGISWVVHVCDCPVHFHFAFFKRASCWSEAAGAWGVCLLSLETLWPLAAGLLRVRATFVLTRVKELNPLQRELPGLLHHVVYVGPDNAVGLRTSFYRCSV